MQHYGCEPERTNARCANENGDVESANGHVKDRIDQGLLLRGSRDFASRDDYMAFVEQTIARANANRRERFREEQASLDKLPDYRLDTDDVLRDLRVSSSSTIQVRANTFPNADGKTQGGRSVTDDGPVSRASSAELSRSLSAGGDSCSDGASQSLGLSFGVNDTGMRNSAGGSHPALDDTLATSAGQDLGLVRLPLSVKRQLETLRDGQIY